MHLALDSVGIFDKELRSFCMSKMRENRQSSGHRQDMEIERNVEARIGKIRAKIFFKLVTLNFNNFILDLRIFH